MLKPQAPVESLSIRLDFLVSRCITQQSSSSRCLETPFVVVLECGRLRFGARSLRTVAYAQLVQRGPLDLPTPDLCPIAEHLAMEPLVVAVDLAGKGTETETGVEKGWTGSRFGLHPETHSHGRDCPGFGHLPRDCLKPSYGTGVSEIGFVEHVRLYRRSVSP